MKPPKLAAPLVALVASWLCGCASPPGLGPASRERASAASVSAEPTKPSPSAIERASPLAPSPFRLVGELPLDLHVLEDGRVVGERHRRPTPEEVDRGKPAGFVRDFLLLRGRRFEHVHQHFGVIEGWPSIRGLVGAPDGAIDAFAVFWDGNTILVRESLLGPLGREPGTRYGFETWAGHRTWAGMTLALMTSPGSHIVSVRGPEWKLNRTPDPNCWSKVRVDAAELWSTDEELFAFGTDCDGNGQLVEIWRLGEKNGRVVAYHAGAPPVELVVPLVPAGEPSRVWRGEDGNVYVAGESPQIYDNTAFSTTLAIAPPPAFRARNGRLYRATGNREKPGWGFCSEKQLSLCWGHWAPRLFEVVDGVEREVALPGPEPLLHVFDGTLWVHTRDGKLYRLEDGIAFEGFEITNG